MGYFNGVSCNVPSCSKGWDRHPVLEEPCPSCEAAIGEMCKRPSGHPVNSQFGKYHAERYYLSLDEGHFGECPEDRCPESSAVSKDRQKEENSPKESTTKQTTLT